MYATSTQKKSWTFKSLEEVNELRVKANENFRHKYELVLQDGEDSMFLTVEDESLLRKIVSETGFRFSESFEPKMWPSVRWTAFAYFKRFYLYQSTMEYSPKNVMMACFYLAAKVDEFNISTRDFVLNLKSGSPKSNTDAILSLEPIIMQKMRYHLTVHSPYRAFEGHLIEMKALSLLGFDLEQVRAHAESFLTVFQRAMLGDVMFLYSPSQIALAALKYGLRKLGKSENLIKEEYLDKLLKIESWQEPSVDEATCNKLLAQLDRIIKCVLDAAEPAPEQESKQLHNKMQDWVMISNELDERMKQLNKSIEEDDSTSS